MRKKYQQPVMQIVHCPMEHLLQSGSDANEINGTITIHSSGTNEMIGSGNEDDEEGIEASSKSSSFGYEW